MNADEQTIRDAVDTWHEATAAGDLSRILPLMAEDAARLAGPVLTILRKQEGRWVVVRDANMLAPDPERMP